MSSVIQSDPFLELSSRGLRKTLTGDELVTYGQIEIYLHEYMEYHGLDQSFVVSAHQKFIKQYSRDLKTLVETGCFPFQLSGKQPVASEHISRIEYDVSLMLSTLLTSHRFYIMHTVNQIRLNSQYPTLIVGVGSGLELYLLAEGQLQKDSASRNKDDIAIDAFDLNLSDFVKSKFGDYKNVRLQERPFEKFDSIPYGDIFLIELLEHLDAPYEFLSMIVGSLRSDGKLYATTIKNVPQFDHIFNFTDEEDFEKRVSDMGLAVEQKIRLPHEYKNLALDSNNIFYFLRPQK